MRWAILALSAMAVAACGLSSGSTGATAAGCAPLYRVPATGTVACRDADIGAGLVNRPGPASAERELDRLEKEVRPR